MTTEEAATLFSLLGMKGFKRYVHVHTCSTIYLAVETDTSHCESVQAIVKVRLSEVLCAVLGLAQHRPLLCSWSQSQHKCSTHFEQSFHRQQCTASASSDAPTISGSLADCGARVFAFGFSSQGTGGTAGSAILTSTGVAFSGAGSRSLRSGERRWKKPATAARVWSASKLLPESASAVVGGV